MRLFVAATLSPDLSQSLIAAQNALRKQGTGRFTQPENLHLTLAFIGETQFLPEAKSALKTLHIPSFTLAVQHVGSFGDLYWAGVQLTESLQSAQTQVAKALRSAGFALEEREYRPHLTLCRQYRPFNTLDIDAVETVLGSPTCHIRQITLMESHRPAGKLVYTPRFILPLY